MEVLHINKKSLFFVFFINVLVLAAIYYFASQLNSSKIAYIDTDRLLNSYQGMITARAQYQREKQEWQQNIETLGQEAQQAVARAQQAVKSANSAEKLIREREARFKQEQLLNYQQAVAKQEPQEMARLTQPIIASVNHHIATYSQVHQYNLVLTTAGQGDVVYLDKKLDITKEVADYLNKYTADSLARTSGTADNRKLTGQP